MSPTRRRRRQTWLDRHWTDIMRLTGWAGLIFTAAVWFLTDRLSPELLAAFGTLMGVGEGLDALKELAASRAEQEDRP